MRVSGGVQGVAIRTPARFRLTCPVPPEDELHLAVADALRYCARATVVNTWELRNASSAVEGGRRKRLGALRGGQTWGCSGLAALCCSS